jgi:F-type H+-transporting ATPase subunit b
VNINLTLLGQMITFLLFVMFTKHFVWPFLQQALRERQEKIADGLAAAERGHKDLALAQENATKQIRSTKEEAAKIIEEAKKHALQIIENAKEEAVLEGDKVKTKVEADIEQMMAKAQDGLRQKAAKMALLGAEKVLGKNIDEAANQDLLDSLVRGL